MSSADQPYIDPSEIALEGSAAPGFKTAVMLSGPVFEMLLGRQPWSYSLAWWALEQWVKPMV